MKIKRALLVAALAAGAAWLLAHPGSASQTVSGTIEVDEVRVASRSGGRVSALHAGEGDSLTNGQIIAELQADELKAQRDFAAARLAELEHGPRTQEIDAARSDWEALAADYGFALDDSKRKKSLFEARTISSTERDEAISKADALKDKAAAAERRYDMLAAGMRPEVIDQARALLDEIEAKVAELMIHAPADSTLETLQVKLGDVVPPGGAIATLLYQDSRWLRVYVPEPWLPRISRGQEVQLRVDGITGEVFHGVVEQIARKAEFTPRNVQTPEERVKQVFGVKIRIVDDGGRLRAGMTADAEFPGLSR